MQNYKKYLFDKELATYYYSAMVFCEKKYVLGVELWTSEANRAKYNGHIVVPAEPGKKLLSDGDNPSNIRKEQTLDAKIIHIHEPNFTAHYTPVNDHLTVQTMEFGQIGDTPQGCYSPKKGAVTLDLKGPEINDERYRQFLTVRWGKVTRTILVWQNKNASPLIPRS